MEMKQCSNGHYYDAARTPECPYCNSASANVNMTRPLNVDQTMPLQGNVNDEINVTRPQNAAPFSSHVRPEDGVTVALIKKDLGIDPVVGWLVCVEGGDKGRDYRIHAQRNFIGRSEKMDICIRGDETISRENQAIVSYDNKKKTFRLFPGDGKGIVYLNDEEIFTATELKAYDIIEIGTTKLLFIPLCGEKFEWR